MILFPILLIILLTFIARILHKKWLHPGVFTLLLWMLIIFFVVIFAPDYKLHLSSLWWILITLIFIYTGSIVGESLVFKNKISVEFALSICSDNLYRLSNFLSSAVILSLFFFILGIMVLVQWATGDLSMLLSIEGIKSLGFKLSSMRYGGGDYKQPILYSVFSYGLTFAALIGGVLFFISSRRKYFYISLLPLAFAFINAIVKTQRGTIIFTLILWFSAYLATNILIKKGHFKVFTFKRILLMIFLMGLSLFIFVALQASREGEFNMDFIDLALLNFKGSAFGSLPAFSYWFDSTFSEEFEYTWGEFTFNRIMYYIFEVPSRAPGMFGEAIWLGDTYREGTTIYTVFRAVLQDFGMVGSLLIWLAVGLIGGVAYRKLMQGDVRYIPILSMFYSFTLIGYLASMFSWNGVVISYIVFTVYFFWKFNGLKYGKN